jgi:hypothetical protein
MRCYQKAGHRKTIFVGVRRNTKVIVPPTADGRGCAKGPRLWLTPGLQLAAEGLPLRTGRERTPPLHCHYPPLSSKFHRKPQFPSSC